MTDLSGKGPISSGMQPGPGEHMAGPAGSDSGGATAGKMFSAGGVRETGARLATGAQHYASDFAQQALNQSRSMFHQQKETAVGQVDQVSHAIRNAASQLHGEGQSQAARYVGLIADQLDSLSSRLRHKELDSIIHDTQNLARRAPGTFFIGSVLGGFLLARFMKSSSSHQGSAIQSSGAYGQSASSGQTMSSGTLPVANQTTGMTGAPATAMDTSGGNAGVSSTLSSTGGKSL